MILLVFLCVIGLLISAWYILTCCCFCPYPAIVSGSWLLTFVLQSLFPIWALFFPERPRTLWPTSSKVTTLLLLSHVLSLVMCSVSVSLLIWVTQENMCRRVHPGFFNAFVCDSVQVSTNLRSRQWRKCCYRKTTRWLLACLAQAKPQPSALW